MGKKLYPTDTLTQALRIARAWQHIDPALKISTMTLESFAVDMEALQELQRKVIGLQSQLVEVRSQRDEAGIGLWNNVTRTRSFMKGFYGADSTEYKLAGGTRGIVGQMLFFETTNFGGARYGACLYRNGVPPPEPVAYGIQCDPAVAVWGERDPQDRDADDDEVREVFTSLLSWGPGGPPRPTGRVAAGVWYDQQGTVERVGSQAFYVSFDDDAPIPDKEKTWRLERGRLIQDWHYEGPAIGSGGGVCTHPIHACALFLMRATDRFLEVEIEDATGTPVLASARNAGAVEHCRHANAGLYYSNREEFVEALRLLTTNSRLRNRLGENGRTYIRQNFKWDAVLGRFDRLVARARPR